MSRKILDVASINAGDSYSLFAALPVAKIMPGRLPKMDTAVFRLNI